MESGSRAFVFSKVPLLFGRSVATYEILSAFPSGEQRKFLALQRGYGNFRKLVVARPIPDPVRTDEVSFRQTLREARTLGLFSHPNVADVFDLAEHEQRLYLFSEFVPGASLGEVIRACRHANLRLPLEATLRIIQHAAMGLHYAHHFVDPAGRNMGLLHRNLSDEALTIGFDGLTRVTDFCLIAPDGGSPFRAPEQQRGEALDPRTDVYALGVILRRALLELKEHAIPTPTIKIPSRLEQIAQRATERARDQRFVNMAEFARECEAAAGRGWEPLQLAAFVQRLFEERRTRVAELVGPSENFKESTARARLGQIFDDGGKGPEAAAAVEEASRPAVRSPFAAGAAGDEADTSPELEGQPSWSQRPPDEAVRATRLMPRRAPLKERRSLLGTVGRAAVILVVAGVIFGAGATVVDPKWIDRAVERVQALVAP